MEIPDIKANFLLMDLVKFDLSYWESLSDLLIPKIIGFPEETIKEIRCKSWSVTFSFPSTKYRTPEEDLMLEIALETEKLSISWFIFDFFLKPAVSKSSILSFLKTIYTIDCAVIIRHEIS